MSKKPKMETERNDPNVESLLKRLGLSDDSETSESSETNKKDITKSDQSGPSYWLIALVVITVVALICLFFYIFFMSSEGPPTNTIKTTLSALDHFYTPTSIASPRVIL